MINSWVLIFCLYSASCITVQFDSSALCEAAKIELTETKKGQADAWCVKQRKYP